MLIEGFCAAVHQAVENVAHASGLVGFHQKIVDVFQQRHFSVLRRVIRIDQGVVVVGDAFPGICADQGLIKQLLFLMTHIRNQQAEKDMKLLDLPGEDGVLIDNAVNDRVRCLVHAPDRHDIDALLRRRADGNELAAHVFTGSEELVPFERGDNEYLCAFAPHAQSHELHRKGLASTGCAQDRHVRVLIDFAVEDIHNDQTVVVLVHAEQDAVFV